VTNIILENKGPIFDHVTLPLAFKERDSILLPNASIASHIFRLPPSPEVDAAWERIAHDGVIVLTEDEIRRVGKDPRYSVQTHPSWGYPEGSYVALVDSFHQIHCLNALRKGLIYNYQYYWGSKYGFNPPSMFEVHLNHCIDILLQDLMCYADTSPVTYTWVKDNREPYPDFAVNRQCRDFEALVQWREEHMIPNIQEKGKDYTVPPNAPERPPIPGFVEFEKSQITGWKEDKPTGPLRDLPPACQANSP
jgi:hypothetical protein